MRNILGNYEVGEKTDFEMLMGAMTLYDMDDPGKIFSSYWISSDSGESKDTSKLSTGNVMKVTSRKFGVRPVIKYSDIKSEAREISKTPYFVIEYGEYPQTASAR